MGGTIAVGVLMNDGSVSYYLVSDISTYEVMNTTTGQHSKFAEILVPSVDEFFKYELFEEEDSAIRYLVVDETTIIYRYYGGNEEYTLTKKTLT